MADLKIYVASLSDYNSGHLHGKWINVSDVDSMLAEVRQILRTSRHPNVWRLDFKCECGHEVTRTLEYEPKPHRIPNPIECTECDDGLLKPVGEPYESAEEWAIHDYDGVRPHGMGEHTGLETVVAWLEVLEKAEERDIPDEVAAALAEHYGEPDKGNFAQTLDALDDNYAGKGNTLKDWCEEFEEETGELDKIPERYRSHIDFESIARDMQLGGDIIDIRVDGDVYVFWSR